MTDLEFKLSIKPVAALRRPPIRQHGIGQSHLSNRVRVARKTPDLAGRLEEQQALELSGFGYNFAWELGRASACVRRRMPFLLPLRFATAKRHRIHLLDQGRDHRQFRLGSPQMRCRASLSPQFTRRLYRGMPEVPIVAG